MLYSSPYIAIAALAYLAFVFLSESFNPFRASKGPGRRRWRLVRSLTLLFFIVSIAAIQADSHLELPQEQIWLGAIAGFVFLSLLPIYRFLRIKRVSKKNDSMGLSGAATTTQDLTEDEIESVHNMPEVTASDIRKLEMELHIPTHDTEYEDLDQTIAEAEADAEINIADLTDPEIKIVAKPEFSSSSNTSNMGAYDEASDFLQNRVNGNTHNSTTNSFKASLFKDAQNENTHDMDLSDAFMKILDAQNKEIEELEKRNRLLTETNESLVVEITKLKSSLKNFIGVARKSIVQRDQAIEMKNSALTFATIEQKKRKSTDQNNYEKFQKMRDSSEELAG